MGDYDGGGYTKEEEAEGVQEEATLILQRLAPISAVLSALPLPKDDFTAAALYVAGKAVLETWFSKATTEERIQLIDNLNALADEILSAGREALGL